MPALSLGTIEVLGLPAAVEAADVACKTADVTLIGYETTDGMGMVAVKIQGQVSAVTSAVAAAGAAAARVSKVFATSVIARPSEQLEPIVFTKETVGLPKPAPAPAPEPVEPAEPTPEPLVEPVETPTTVSTSSAGDVPEEPPVEPVETPTAVSTSSTSGDAPATAEDVTPAPRRASTRKPRPTKK